MIAITNGMTPTEVITTLNANFAGKGTVLTSAMTGAQFLAGVNNNTDWFNSRYSSVIGDVSAGMKSSEFGTLLNNGTSDLNSRIPSVHQTEIIDAIADEDEVVSDVETDAILDFMTGLVAQNLFFKFKAIYPWLGSDIDSVKYNLMDARDHDDAFRLDISTGANITTLMGADPIANSGDTHLVIGDDLAMTDYHISYYACENIQGNNTTVAGASEGGVGNNYLVLSSAANKFFANINSSNNSLGDALPNTIGWYVANSYNSRIRTYKDAVRLDDDAFQAGGAVASYSNYVFSRNDNSVITNPTQTKSGLATWGYGLTDDEVTAINTLVHTFITETGRYDTENYDLLSLTEVDNPHLPATETNANISRYINWKLGGLICFSPYTWKYVFNKPANPALLSHLTNIDVDKWVSDAHDAGIQYLVFTILDTSGYALFDNPITYPDYLLNQCWGYRKFDVAVSKADLNIVDKFFAACQTYGIEPIPYVCPTSNTAICINRSDHSIFGPQNGYDATDKQYYDNWFAKVLQYIMTTWSPRYMWIDAGGWPIVNDNQVFYDAVKSINANCTVISNNAGDRDFNFFPYDIGSNEEYYTLWGENTWDNVLTTVRTKDEVDYYTPQEVVTNLMSGGAGARYYWNDQALRSAVGDLQNIYNIAKAHGCPFLLSLAPNRNGIIPSAQFDVFKALVL